MPRPPVKKELNHVKPEFQMVDIDEKSETIERFKRERLKRNDSSCVEFWACLVFQSFEQRNSFLEQLKLNGVTSILYDKYIDGEEFADKHGYVLDKNDLPPEKSNINKKRTAMVNVAKIRAASK